MGSHVDEAIGSLPREEEEEEGQTKGGGDGGVRYMNT